MILVIVITVVFFFSFPSSFFWNILKDHRIRQPSIKSRVLRTYRGLHIIGSIHIHVNIMGLAGYIRWYQEKTLINIHYIGACAKAQGSTNYNYFAE